MSVHVTTWVYDNAPEDLKPSEMLVALVMADHANGEGGYSFPSVARISKLSRLGESTVRAALASLCELGVIALTKEATSKMPATYRFPRFSRGAGSGTQNNSGVQDLAPRGAGSAPEPLINQTKDTPPPTPSNSIAEGVTDERGVEKAKQSINDSPAQQGSGAPPGGGNGVSNGMARELEQSYWQEPDRLKAFEFFYDKHPKMSPKLEAMIYWRMNIPSEVIDDRAAMGVIWHGYQWWLNKWRKEGTEQKFIPSFGRWIERRQWEQANAAM
jgi:hypothetical protein